MAFSDADLQRLLMVFDRVDAAGARVHSEADVKAFIPILFFAAGVHASAKPGSALAKAMTAFASKAGLKADMPEDVARDLLAVYLDTNPPARALADDVKALLLELRTPDADRAAAMFGDAKSKIPVGAREAPAGSHKASPLARFKMTKK